MRESSSKRRIVVADDEQDIANLLTISLETNGYSVESVHDGQAALDTIRATLPDLVLLDVMMPELDGVEVLMRLKSDPRTAHIPVVMLTAKGGDDDVWDGWQSGANYYLTKPFGLDEVLRCVAQFDVIDLVSGP